MRRIDLAIITILAMHGKRSSLLIEDSLQALGFWFVQARCWPALRRLERQGFIQRFEEPGGPERGGRPAYSFALKAYPKL